MNSSVHMEDKGGPTEDPTRPAAAGDATGEVKAGNDDGDPALKVVESLVLGVVSWWAGKFHRNQVLNLVTRHYLASEVHEASLKLAKACQHDAPVKHNNTGSRSACEANAIDLVNTLVELDNQKKKPRILIPSDQLEKVPFDALAISAERSVSARLESLEQCVKDVTNTMQIVLKNSSKETASMPPMPLPSASPAEDLVSFTVQPCQDDQSYAGAAAAAVGASVQLPRVPKGSNLVAPPARVRSKSPAVKRKHGDADGVGVGGVVGDGPGGDGAADDGFRKPGRPRKTGKGASKVQVEGVGDYQPSLQYYIGNTPGKATAEVIKKVLSKCSVPLTEGAPLEVEDVELLTQGDNPRTKCWRVVVPYQHMTLMENPELYPEGWRHRKFFGSRKVQETNKQPRLGGSIVDEVMNQMLSDVGAVGSVQDGATGGTSATPP